MKKRLRDEQDKTQHNMVSELPHHHSFTTNQPIESTVSNQPIFGNVAKLCNGTCIGESPISTCPIHTYFESEERKMLIKMSRVWAMPSKDTFTIKPIAELLKRYIPAGGIEWIDPFAGNNSPAELTNDHNPETNAKYHEEAKEFVETIKSRMGKSRFSLFAGALFDPPYSYRQVSEHYKVIGKKATQLDTSTQFFNRVLNPLGSIIRPGGYCISFGWNTNGMGKNRDFRIVEILIVAHGGHHNDTLVTVEQKL